jgi:hypothetical protein
MELNRDINLVTCLATVLGVVDLRTLAVIAVGGHTEDASTMLVALVGIVLAIHFILKAGRTGREGQGSLHVVAGLTLVVLRGKEFRSLKSVGFVQEDSNGIGPVDLLKFRNKSLEGEQKVGRADRRWFLPPARTLEQSGLQSCTEWNQRHAQRQELQDL